MLLLCTAKYAKPTPRLLKGAESRFSFLCSQHQVWCGLCFWDFNVQIHVYTCDVVEQVRSRWKRFLTSTLPELVLLLLRLLVGFADKRIVVSDTACLCASSVHVVRLLISSLLSLLDIPSRRTAAA